MAFHEVGEGGWFKRLGTLCDGQEPQFSRFDIFCHARNGIKLR
jgi:hypothetical protein